MGITPMAIITPINVNTQLVLAHNADKYTHPSGNVYAFTKGGKDNKKMRVALFNMFGNLLLAELIFCLESRFNYWSDDKGFWTLIRPNEERFKEINKHKPEGSNGVQKSIMEESGIRDKETFIRHYKKIGSKYESFTRFEEAYKANEVFGIISPEHPNGTLYYSAYLNNSDHLTYFIRNNKLANSHMNWLRKSIKIPASKDVL